MKVQQVDRYGTTGRLVRFLFDPPALGAVPLRPGGFAHRLARSPVDLLTKLGMERANAYYDAGCPLELCDHAAARDLWRVIYRDVIGEAGEEPAGTTGALRGGPGVGRKETTWN
jgi:hypothetical protein